MHKLNGWTQFIVETTSAVNFNKVHVRVVFLLLLKLRLEINGRFGQTEMILREGRLEVGLSESNATP